jgi:hypothetical protein
MKKSLKALALSVALLGFLLAPNAALALPCNSFSACSDDYCVVCFATSSPNGSGCAYKCVFVQ